MSIEKPSDVTVSKSTAEETLRALGLEGLSEDEIGTELLAMLAAGEIDEGILTLLGYDATPPPLPDGGG